MFPYSVISVDMPLKMLLGRLPSMQLARTLGMKYFDHIQTIYAATHIICKLESPEKDVLAMPNIEL